MKRPQKFGDVLFSCPKTVSSNLSRIFNKRLMRVIFFSKCDNVSDNTYDIVSPFSNVIWLSHHHFGHNDAYLRKMSFFQFLHPFKIFSWKAMMSLGMRILIKMLRSGRSCCQLQVMFDILYSIKFIWYIFYKFL